MQGIAEITQALTCRLGNGGPDDNKAQGGFYLAAYGGNNTKGPIEVAARLACNESGSGYRLDFESDTFIAHTLRAEGFDASEDGTGRQNLVVTPINTQIGLRHQALGERTGLGIGELGDPAFTLQRAHSHAVCVTSPLTGNPYGDHESREGLLVPVQSPGNVLAFDSTQITSPHNHSNPRPGDPCHPISARAHAPAIVFHGSQDPSVSGDVTHPCGRNGGRETCVMGFMAGQGAKAGSIAASKTLSPTLKSANSGGNMVPSVLIKSAVRRLTPVECERLQGFPDEYTAIPYRQPFGNLPKPILERSYQRYLRRMARQGKEPLQLDEIIKCADGPRYKALGNSMAVLVMRWLGERIAKALKTEVHHEVKHENIA